VSLLSRASGAPGGRRTAGAAATDSRATVGQGQVDAQTRGGLSGITDANGRETAAPSHPSGRRTRTVPIAAQAPGRVAFSGEQRTMRPLVVAWFTDLCGDLPGRLGDRPMSDRGSAPSLVRAAGRPSGVLPRRIPSRPSRSSAAHRSGRRSPTRSVARRVLSYARARWAISRATASTICWARGTPNSSMRQLGAVMPTAASLSLRSTAQTMEVTPVSTASLAT
jgi:hypothetical protein